MLATLADELPAGDGWTFEVKWDGYRTLAVKDGARVSLWSRNLKNVTRQYASVVRAIERLRAGAAVLDGEIVALDEEGRPSFQALHHQSATAFVYYAFDALHADGRDLTRAPIEARRHELAQVIEGSRVLHSEPLPGAPDDIEAAVRAAGLEGVVAKRGGSIYQPGKRSTSWLKVKFNKRQEFVVGGFKPNAASFDSLLVGYYEKRKLHFAGRVRAGLTPGLRAKLFPRIAPHRIAQCPFADLPNARSGHWGEGITAADMTKLCWVEPRLVVEVSFVEWTRDGLLRHSKFEGVREDKRPSAVRRET